MMQLRWQYVVAGVACDGCDAVVRSDAEVLILEVAGVERVTLCAPCCVRIGWAVREREE